MDEAAKRQLKKDLRTAVMKQYDPAVATRLEQESAQLERRLLESFKDRPDAEELALALRHVIRNWAVMAHYLGIRRGYEVARDISKMRGKREDAARSVIEQALRHNPKATNKQILRALDNAEVLIDKAKGMPKNMRLWEDAADIQHFKTLIWRARKKFAKKRSLRGWQKLMKAHERLRNAKGLA